MGLQRTLQAIDALEQHLKHHDSTDQPCCHVANTLALISIAQSLDTLCEIGTDIPAVLKHLTGVIERR